MKSWGRSATSLKKETLAYVYSCKFCEIFNTCFKKPPVAPSIHPKSLGCCKSSASSSDIFNHSFWSIIWRLGHYFTNGSLPRATTWGIKIFKLIFKIFKFLNTLLQLLHPRDFAGAYNMLLTINKNPEHPIYSLLLADVS